MGLGKSGHPDGQVRMVLADMGHEVRGMGKGGEQFGIGAGVAGGPIAAQGQDIVDPQPLDRVQETIDFLSVGGDPGEMRHDRKAAGGDQPVADLQGVGLGGTAGTVGHRGKQWIELTQILGDF